MWRQAVVLLPFIEETRLLDAIAEVEPTLTPEERSRNARRIDSLFLGSGHPMAKEVLQVAERAAGLAPDKLHEAAVALDPEVRPRSCWGGGRGGGAS